MRILFALLLLSGVSLAQTGFTNRNLDNLNAAPAKANLLGIGMAAGFADPNADRILFWDDSAGAYAPLTLGTNLSITGTTIDAAGGAGSTDLSYTAATRLLASSSGADVTLPLFTSTEAGLTPLSGGGTTNFLRADGTWAAPAGSGGFDSAGDYTLTGVWDYTGATVTFGTFSATTLNATTFQIGGADITATAAELNLLDGVTTTTAELNFVDGVTSAIQTQLDSKLSTQTDTLIVAISDETTAITTGTAKVTVRAPYAMTITGVKASLSTVSSSGLPTFDINEGGVSVLSTKITIDASEKTSTTAATAAVVSDTAIANDAEITFDIDAAGTGATGAKVYITHTH